MRDQIDTSLPTLCWAFLTAAADIGEIFYPKELGTKQQRDQFVELAHKSCYTTNHLSRIARRLRKKYNCVLIPFPTSIDLAADGLRIRVTINYERGTQEVVLIELRVGKELPDDQFQLRAELKLYYGNSELRSHGFVRSHLDRPSLKPSSLNCVTPALREPLRKWLSYHGIATTPPNKAKSPQREELAAV